MQQLDHPIDEKGMEQIDAEGAPGKSPQHPGLRYRVKKLIYVTTAGGYITQNLGFAYADALFRTFFGVEETVCVKADGLDILGNNAAAILAEAKAEYLRR